MTAALAAHQLREREVRRLSNGDLPAVNLASLPSGTNRFFCPAARRPCRLGRAVNRRMWGRSFLRYVHAGLLLIGAVLLVQAMRR